MAKTDYTVTFERVSRDHNVPDLKTKAADANELAEKIYRYAAGRCVSSNVEVVVNATDGVILAGFHEAGSFTISPPVASQ